MKPSPCLQHSLRFTLALLMAWFACSSILSAQLTISPSNFNFGTVTEWTNTTSSTFTVTNTLASTLQICGVAAGGQYYLTGVAINGTPVTSYPVAFPAGQSLTFTANFFPATTVNIYGGVVVEYWSSGTTVCSAPSPTAIYAFLQGAGGMNTNLALTTPPALPAATVSVPYSEILSATGGASGALTFSLGTGSHLPPGLSLSPVTGQRGKAKLSGTPTCTTTPCQNSFVLKVTDTMSHTASITFNLGVYATNGTAICANTSWPPPPSTALLPINDLGAGSYQGFVGGLYGGGSNSRPPAYTTAGQAAATAILNKGLPKIVLLAIGFSNPNLEFGKLVGLQKVDPNKNPNLVLVNAALGSEGACCLNVSVVPNSCSTIQGKQPCDVSNYFQPGIGYVDTQLSKAGVTSDKVVAVWLKETNVNPTTAWPGPNPPACDTFPCYIQQKLQSDIEYILTQDLSATPPNGQLPFINLEEAYLASRTYAGYASDNFNPESYAYETGFAVQGEVAKNISPGIQGAPWFDWGPYLWTNGMNQRNDGLTWSCQDVMAKDGRHPSDPVGQMEVAVRLLNYFKNDLTTAPWFNAPAH